MLNLFKKYVVSWFGSCRSDIDHETDVVFEHIYKEALWGSNTLGIGTSGYGSLIRFNVEYIKFLQDFIIAHSIKIVVDIGCGDWQFSDHIYKHTNVIYYGYDCVKSLIDSHRMTYKSIPRYHFIHCNGSALILHARCKNGDLLIMKDVLQHWPNTSIVTFLDAIIKKKKYTYILLTNDHTLNDNVDIFMGDYRPINWNKAPFDKYNVKEVFAYVAFREKATMLLQYYF